MTEWIYESPDGGKTIIRRPRRELEHMGNSILINGEAWWDVYNLRKIARNLIAEQHMRDIHPVLQQLWDQYHTMRNIIEN